MNEIISKIQKIDQKKAKDNNYGPSKRVSNIVWPSETMVSQGNVNIGSCRRAVFYKAIGATQTNPMDSTGRRICDIGKVFEDYYISRLKETGLPVKEQVKVRYEMPGTRNKVIESGKADCVTNNTAIEVKSIGSYGGQKIFGSKYSDGLPKVENFLQALLYEFYFTHIDKGKKHNVNTTSLLYIDRSYVKEMYYTVKLNNDGYATITSISDNYNETINFSKERSIYDLANSSKVASDNEYRRALLKINIDDIFKKADSLYDYIKNNELPPRDYSFIYSPNELEFNYKIGKVNKNKYRQAKSGEPIGDKQCRYCNFRDKCMKDSKLN